MLGQVLVSPSQTLLQPNGATSPHLEEFINQILHYLESHGFIYLAIATLNLKGLATQSFKL